MKFEYNNFNNKKLSFEGNVVYTHFSEYGFENINNFLFPFLYLLLVVKVKFSYVSGKHSEHHELSHL